MDDERLAAEGASKIERTFNRILNLITFWSMVALVAAIPFKWWASAYLAGFVGN